jgi:hypothetical protein
MASPDAEEQDESDHAIALDDEDTESTVPIPVGIKGAVRRVSRIRVCSRVY